MTIEKYINIYSICYLTSRIYYNTESHDNAIPHKQLLQIYYSSITNYIYISYTKIYIMKKKSSYANSGGPRSS